MKIQEQPDYLIFADEAKTGEVQDFPNVARGWGVTIDQTAGKPPLEWFNAIGKRSDEWSLYLTQRGLAEWHKDVDYPKFGAVQYNGKYYVSKTDNKGNQPDTSQVQWSLLADFIGAPKSVSEALGTKVDKTQIKQVLGNSITDVMSQNAVTVELAKKQSVGDYLTIKGGTIEGSLHVAGQLSENGQRVYSPSNKPTAATIGALPTTGGTVTGNLNVTGTLRKSGQNVLTAADLPKQAVVVPNYSKPTVISNAVNTKFVAPSDGIVYVYGVVDREITQMLNIAVNGFRVFLMNKNNRSTGVGMSSSFVVGRGDTISIDVNSATVAELTFLPYK